MTRLKITEYGAPDGEPAKPPAPWSAADVRDSLKHAKHATARRIAHETVVKFQDSAGLFRVESSTFWQPVEDVLFDLLLELQPQPLGRYAVLQELVMSFISRIKNMRYCFKEDAVQRNLLGNVLIEAGIMLAYIEGEVGMYLQFTATAGKLNHFGDGTKLSDGQHAHFTKVNAERLLHQWPANFKSISDKEAVTLDAAAAVAARERAAAKAAGTADKPAAETAAEPPADPAEVEAPAPPAETETQ